MKLEISDGQRSINLLSGGSIYAVQEGFDLPVPGRDVTYIEPVDGDGRRRIRTKDTNGEGRIQAMISGTSDANFWDNVDNLLEIVQSAHRDRGSITYTPPGGTDDITWDLEAITVTGLPQKGQQLATRRAECEIAFETLPYGRLPGTAVNLGGTVAHKVLSGPIGYAEVSGIAGQIEAFADLELKDTSGENRRHVEIGVQNVFDPANPEPILLTAGTMSAAQGTLEAFSGFAGTASAPAGAFTTQSSNSLTVRCILAQERTTMVGTGKQPHSGLWKVRARVYSANPAIRVRLAWRSGGGQWSREQWRVLPKTNTWLDIDLGTVDIPKNEPEHYWEARVEGISEVGFPTVHVDLISLIPADRFIRLRGLRVLENDGKVIAGDDFQGHAAGTLNAKTPPLTSGGNWASSSVYSVVQRETKVVSSSATNSASGQFARLGTANFDDIQFSTDIYPYPSLAGTYIEYPDGGSGTLGDSSAGHAGVVLRYKDSNNFVRAFYTRNVYQRAVSPATRFSEPTVTVTPTGNALLDSIFGGSLTFSGISYPLEPRIVTDFDYLSLHLQKVVGGTATSLGRVDFGPISGSNRSPIGGVRKIQVIAGTAGDIEVWEGPLGGGLSREIRYPGDAQLATGGTLDSGQFGLYHRNNKSSVDSTYFLSINAQDPGGEENIQPAIRANNDLQVTHDASYTLAGTIGERSVTPIREGEYLRLRPATRNGTKSRIVVKVRRNDLEIGEEDTGLSDQVEARLEVTPRVILQ